MHFDERTKALPLKVCWCKCRRFLWPVGAIRSYQPLLILQQLPKIQVDPVRFSSAKRKLRLQSLNPTFEISRLSSTKSNIPNFQTAELFNNIQIINIMKFVRLVGQICEICKNRIKFQEFLSIKHHLSRTWPTNSSFLL